jgi:hypothetical protein
MLFSVASIGGQRVQEVWRFSLRSLAACESKLIKAGHFLWWYEPVAYCRATVTHFLQHERKNTKFCSVFTFPQQNPDTRIAITFVAHFQILAIRSLELDIFG